MRYLIGLVLSVAITADAAPVEDTIFVRTDTEGVYAGERGEIVVLTPSYVILRASSGDRLFSREAVQRIELTKNLTNLKQTEWRKVLATYWNTDRSPIVRAVQTIPVVGQPLRILDSIPTGVAATLASVALCLVIAWAAYKAYELTILGRETHRLNTLRLQMEITKLRHEALELSRRLDLPDAEVLAAISLPLPVVPGEASIALSKQDFKHSSLLTPFITHTERLDQRHLYRLEARLAYERGTGHAWWKRLKHTSWLSVGVAFCAMYTFVALYSSVAYFSPRPESDSPASPLLGVLCVAFGVLFARLTVRCAIKDRDVRDAYESVKLRPRINSDIIGTAYLWCEADAARLRPAGRAGCFIASVAASRRLQVATRFSERHWRQPPRRSGFGTRDRPHSLHQGR